MPSSSVVQVEGRELKLTNLDKVMYPDAGFTKAQIVDYYIRIAPYLLPHLKGRPLTMKRYPDGVGKFFFYEKNCPKHRPEWVQTTAVWSHGNNRWMDYCMVEDVATLVWAANLADIELHTSLSLGKKIEQPTMLVFDLDPGAPADIVQCCRVGLWVREVFDRLGLQSFPKTSGSKGLQVYVPLNTPVTYDATKPFAHELARMLERAQPELVVSDMKKALRVGKIFVDWSQNDQYKTTVCAYSLRAKDRPTASTPVTWDEVGKCLKKKDPSLLLFEAPAVVERAGELGDLFEPVLRLKQKLPKIERLREIFESREMKPVGTEVQVVAPAKPPRRAKAPRKPASRTRRAS